MNSVHPSGNSQRGWNPAKILLGGAAWWTRQARGGGAA
eukprot:CAMPEP_0175722936 /NCGR_PEP_ID=MMETSP0097-20121207/46477_1 /TAXON_ID=311494 /ORGANISM="Alexandrium monilatum, Strain CCMP3105" /LENGTH=37 /DNA_ID= /DNA_START= /DNA_END= /DNA_ORIENTATION=